MPNLCFITTCMGRLAHLRQTLPAAAAQPRSSCVVVDYSCPERSGDWVEQNFPTVKVVRVPNQARFSLARARNQGARAADAPWLSFFDADVLLDPHFAEQALPRLEPGKFYTCQPWVKELTGTCICSQADFFRTGGYDEVIENWGYEDNDLYFRLLHRGVKNQGFPAQWLQAIPHGDDLRVQNFDVKTPPLSMAINSIYSLAKYDLLRLETSTMPLEARKGLYEDVKRLVNHWLETGQECHLRFPLHKSPSWLGPEITATLTYSLTPRTAPPMPGPVAGPNPGQVR